ncbi:Mobile element protein [Cupriavidus basilensis]|uniref:Mobile element protein n=1 Tax=Cupriavidus basilensis TaxID=68895 RepID=A0A0C4Y1H8_9BURK|nr:Mobile element protein [Cupriavidus basilensis]
MRPAGAPATAANAGEPFPLSKTKQKEISLKLDLDAWLDQHNNQREHQGRLRYGKTPMRTFLDSLELAKEKLISH